VSIQKIQHKNFTQKPTFLDKNACSNAALNHIWSALILNTKVQKNGKERSGSGGFLGIFSETMDHTKNTKINNQIKPPKRS